MIRLSLTELMKIVNAATNDHACIVIPGHKGWQERAQQASDAAVARVLRELHLSTWADALERQTKVVTGD